MSSNQDDKDEEGDVSRRDHEEDMDNEEEVDLPDEFDGDALNEKDVPDEADVVDGERSDDEKEADEIEAINAKLVSEAWKTYHRENEVWVEHVLQASASTKGKAEEDDEEEAESNLARNAWEAEREKEKKMSDNVVPAQPTSTEEENVVAVAPTTTIAPPASPAKQLPPTEEKTAVSPSTRSIAEAWKERDQRLAQLGSNPYQSKFVPPARVAYVSPSTRAEREKRVKETLASITASYAEYVQELRLKRSFHANVEREREAAFRRAIDAKLEAARELQKGKERAQSEARVSAPVASFGCCCCFYGGGNKVKLTRGNNNVNRLQIWRVIESRLKRARRC